MLNKELKCFFGNNILLKQLNKTFKNIKLYLNCTLYFKIKFVDIFKHTNYLIFTTEKKC